MTFGLAEGVNVFSGVRSAVEFTMSSVDATTRVAYDAVPVTVDSTELVVSTLLISIPTVEISSVGVISGSLVSFSSSVIVAGVGSKVGKEISELSYNTPVAPDCIEDVNNHDTEAVSTSVPVSSEGSVRSTVIP